MKTVTVEYVYGSYFGRVRVQVEDDDDNETIFAQAKRQLRPHMSLSMACESYRIAEES